MIFKSPNAKSPNHFVLYSPMKVPIVEIAPKVAARFVIMSWLMFVNKKKAIVIAIDPEI